MYSGYVQFSNSSEHSEGSKLSILIFNCTFIPTKCRLRSLVAITMESTVNYIEIKSSKFISSCKLLSGLAISSNSQRVKVSTIFDSLHFENITGTCVLCIHLSPNNDQSSNLKVLNSMFLNTTMALSSSVDCLKLHNNTFDINTGNIDSSESIMHLYGGG